MAKKIDHNNNNNNYIETTEQTTTAFFSTGNSIILRLTNDGNFMGALLLNDTDNTSLINFGELLSKIDIDLTSIIAANDQLDDSQKVVLFTALKMYLKDTMDNDEEDEIPMVSPLRALDPIYHHTKD